jgi:hypothetical protein
MVYSRHVCSHLTSDLDVVYPAQAVRTLKHLMEKEREGKESVTNHLIPRPLRFACKLKTTWV